MLTAGQIRAARGLLDWTQTDLANAAGLAVSSIKNIEGGVTDPNPKTISALRTALELAGVVLLTPGDMRDGGHGVRLKAFES